MVHGLADGVDRIGAIGNGQVPRVVAIAWRVLTANEKLQPRTEAGESLPE